METLQRDGRGGWAPLHELKHESDQLKLTSPPPGIVVIRIEESLTYPNSNHIAKQIKTLVESSTSFGGKPVSNSNRLWCVKPQTSLPTNTNGIFDKSSLQNPILRAIIFDFSAVNGIDGTGLQTLVDVRREVEKYAGRKVLFYFAHVHWQLQSVLHYFLANLDPNREVVPIVTNSHYLDLDAEQELKELEHERLKSFGCESEYCQLFIHRTIDQAIAYADVQSKLVVLLNEDSVSTINH